MAELGDIITGQDGSERILTTKGWVPNTPELESAAAMGTLGALATASVEAGTFGLVQQPEEFEQTSPVASTAPLALELGAGGAGLGALARRGLRGTGGSIAERVVDGRRKAGQLIRRPSDIAGGRATAAGQLVGKLEAGIETIPGLNLGLLAQKAVNQRRVNMAATRAMGGSDELIDRSRLGLDDSVLGELTQQFKQGFRKVEQGISKNIDPVMARPVIDQAIDSNFVTGKLAKALEGGKPSGRELMQVRSKLSEVLASNEQFLVKEQAAEIIEQIDDIIETALSSAGKAEYQSLRSQYRVWANIRRGRGLSPDGQINVRTVGGRMANAKGYGDNYRTILSPGSKGIKGAPEEVNDFLRILREGESLDVGLPNSGTAERSVMTALGIGGIAAVGGGE